MNCSWWLLLLLTSLEVILFQQVFVTQLTDVISLQQQEQEQELKEQELDEQKEQEKGFPGGSLARPLLSLLSVANFCLSLLYLLSLHAANTAKQSRLTKLCARQWKVLHFSIQCWSLLKVSFSACLTLLLWTRVDRARGEEATLLAILAAATGFLVVSQKLTSDLSLLSLVEGSQAGSREQGAGYRPLPVKEYV